MIRSIAKLASVLATASVVGLVTGISFASSAVASPDSGAKPFCSYSLPPPQLIQLPGGATAVTATSVPTSCTGSVGPTTTVVCLSSPEGQGDCSKGTAWSPAEVFVTVPRYSGTFTATGSACWVDITGKPECTTTGPVSTTI